MSELLDYLRESTHCLYLSDLRQPAYRDKAVEAALRLEPERYPLSQWQEALRYLLGLEGGLTIEQVRDALRGNLPK